MPEKTLHFQSPRYLSQLYLGKEENLAKVEEALGVKVVTREDWIHLEGEEQPVALAQRFFEALDRGRSQGLTIRASDFDNYLKSVANGQGSELEELFSNETIVLQLKRKSIVPKTLGQKRYLQAIRTHDIVFGIGPAGTGKTYLAMAAALDAFGRNEVEQLILTRPAVEAGEALGYLPGDLKEKLDPYLRPLYDAMFEMMGKETIEALIRKGTIEIAPLAYMRGRTLSRAFIVLDEAQNTTPEQMMMFLTRLGDESRMIITGDVTQVDLPRHKFSGLKEAQRVLGRVQGIAFHEFDGADVVRNPLVQRIIDAYAEYNERTGAHEPKEGPNRR